MLVKYFSVRDRKAAAFLPPFAARTSGEAIRMFVDAVLDDKHQFHKHPEDYLLFSMFVLDDATGEVESEVREIFQGMQAVQE